jgi:2-dehydro-3-deoxyphosphogluconate aldolase/(4S)-4-hydroxy-2-oxoglutarate aldolase
VRLKLRDIPRRLSSDGQHRSGRSVAWLARLLGVQEVESSNLSAPTILFLAHFLPTPSNRGMASRSEISARIMELGIVAVVRTPSYELVAPVCEALVAGGVLALEVTMTVPDALRALREVNAKLGDQILLGAGTILNTAQCTAAIDAGAQYVISPITKLELIAAAHAREKPVMLGAYTPTEAQLAHESGADFIKIFPADKLGPGYVKNLRAPLPHLRIVPTGGVDLQTAPEFLKAGCAALGVGSSLISAEILKTKNWAELTRLAGEFVRVVRETRAAR